MIPTLKTMFPIQNRRFLLSVALLAAAAPVHAQQAGVALGCYVAEKDADGEWFASRKLTGTNGVPVPMRDTYEWKPNKDIPFGPGMTLSWTISYYWPTDVAAQKVVPENDVAVILNFWFDAQQAEGPLKNPQRSWIHLYRSANPYRDFSLTSTSLINVMLWHQFTNGNMSTKAIIPLDDLLAFGTGFNTLIWNVRTQPNEFGGTQVIAKGSLPIAAMRDRVSNIPRLRQLLDKKAANFRTECYAPIIMVE